MTATTQVPASHNPSCPSEPALQDTPIDVKLRLATLWAAVMFVYAYVDIFGLLLADLLEGLLADEIVNTSPQVNQGFLIFAVVYILPASLMIPLSLTLAPRANRRANLAVAGIYGLTVAAACVGETWIYFLFGSAVELVLFALIARAAWRWPSAPATSCP
ncbi:MAG: DUF6326 family protein [Actinomycetota bacterium]